MKKNTGYFILLLVLILCCTGCTAVGKNDTDREGNSSEDTGVGGDYSGDKEGEAEPSTAPQIERIIYYLDSYEELDELVRLDENGDAPIMKEMDSHGAYYKEFVEGILTGETKIVKPYFGNELLELNKNPHLLYILLECIDGDRPELWYYFEPSYLYPRMELTYLTEEDVEYAQNHSLAEMCECFRGYSCFGTTSIEELTFRDKTVSVLTEVREDETRVYKLFVYDNVFVALVIPEATYNAMDWTQFSLRTE